jgi:hypothetical protein
LAKKLLVPHPRKKSKYTRGWAWTLLLIFLIAATYPLVKMSGSLLVHSDEFDHVDWVIVLEGQTAELERNDAVAALVKEGKVDSVLVAGRRILRTQNMADFYIEDLKELGVDPNILIPYHHDDASTLEEAKSIIPYFKKREIDTVLIITAGFATARAHKIFNTLANGQPVFIAFDIGDSYFKPDTWINHREAREIWLKEMTKNLYTKWELLFEPELELLPYKSYEFKADSHQTKSKFRLSVTSDYSSSSSAETDTTSSELESQKTTVDTVQTKLSKPISDSLK